MLVEPNCKTLIKLISIVRFKEQSQRIINCSLISQSNFSENSGKAFQLP